MSITVKAVQALAKKLYAGSNLQTLYFAIGEDNVLVNGHMIRAINLEKCFVSTSSEENDVMCFEFDILNSDQLTFVANVLEKLIAGSCPTDLSELYGVLTKDSELISRTGIKKYKFKTADILISYGLHFFMKNNITYLVTQDSENMYFCGHCGKMLIPGIDESITDNGVKYCTSCIKQYNYGECAVCHEQHTRTKVTATEEIIKALNLDASLLGKEIDICKSCLNAKLVQCRECGAWIAKGQNYCAICAAGKINEYSYKPAPKYKKVRREDTKLFFGLEIELEAKSDVNVKKLASIVNTRAADCFYCKRDGSLSRGFEIVSEPMTYGFLLQKSDEFHQILQDVLKAGGYSYKATSTGVHIHMSKDAFKDSTHIFNFMKCYYTDRAFTESIALRQANHYCHFDGSSWFSLKDAANCGDTAHDRYRAINMRNANTVEVRIYKGNLKFQTIMMYIQHCLCCFEYAKTMKETDKFVVEDFKKFIREKAAKETGFEMINARVSALPSANAGGVYSVEETTDSTVSAEKVKK